MVTSLLNKLTLGPSRPLPNEGPSNSDFIKALDYEDLERRFQIHKYYPSFIHNYDVSTPTIKSLICDKPIYLKANKHIKNWKNPGTRKTFITEVDLDTGEAAITEKKDDDDVSDSESKRLARKIRKEARRQRHEEKRALEGEAKQAKRQQDSEQRDARKQHERAEKEARKQRHEDYKQLRRDQTLERKEFKRAHKPHYIAHPSNQAAAQEAPVAQKQARLDMMFRNPFDLDMPTLVPSENPNHRSRQMSYDVQANNESLGAQCDAFSVDEPKKRNNSIASRFMGMVKPETRRRHSKFNNLLEPVHTLSSYDATKSTMTLNRSNVTTMLKYKLNENAHRRQSEQIGTY